MTNGSNPLKINIKKDNLQELAYKKIKDAIIEGHFKTGEWLSERRLSEMMEISTSPIKQALSRLVWEGLIENVPRKGRRVLDIKTTLKEASIIRASLEGVAANFAAQKATTRDINQLGDLIKAIEIAVDEKNYSEIVIKNEEFHQSLNIMSRNHYILQHIKILRAYDAKIRKEALKDKKVSQRGFEEHKHIYQLVKDRKGEAVEQQMKEHILKTADYVLKHL